jgi:toxin FitB
MIILDTDVISEAMRPSADPVVSAWLNQQVSETLYLSSISLAELHFGIASLPAGRRKDALTGTLDAVVALFEPRVLSFDAEAARYYGQIAARARAAGKGLPVPDGFIAAIAAAHDFAVATRDIAPFEAAGVSVVNPWDAHG